MNTIQEKLIYKAIKDFNGIGKFFGVFNTAGYQNTLKKEFNLKEIPSLKIAKNHLKNNSRILQLYGGSHWKLSY